MFLSDPDSYDGGELVTEHDDRRVKLPAGHMALYPASSVHRVEPVTRGVRCASFFWVQSMVRSTDDRAMLLELDRAVQALDSAAATTIALTGVYHNLLRRFADV